MHKGYYVLHFVLHLGDTECSKSDKIVTCEGMERGMN